MDVLLIGLGRYGNGLVGRKYTQGEFKAKLIGAVDPNINCIKQKPDYTLGNTPTYHSIDNVPKKIIKNSVSEIALIPQIIPDIFQKIAEEGGKKVILPKPITTTKKSFDKIYKIAEKKGIEAVVASNWYYSEITDFTKNLLEKITGKKESNPEMRKKYPLEFASIKDTFKIEKAEVNYNKQYEGLNIDPPSQELPHALQIVESTGIVDLASSKIELNENEQSRSRVSINISGEKAPKNGVKITSDLQMGEKLGKRRERILNVYLDDDDDAPDVIVDYDAFFTPEGRCLKRPAVGVDITKNGITTQWEAPITEDNLDVMYDRMLGHFEDKKVDALTLDKYKPISDAICKTQQLWEKAVKKQNKKTMN